ncbi:MAG: DUF2007 domain-containing protein [Candidatus Solibacter usitatus]|nr:DUF2007 domain-containing protein [Candidatus Solibacter usitatus]
MEEEIEVVQAGNPAHDLDLERVFRAVGTEAEMEAMAIEGLLRAGGIEAVLIGSSSLPTLPFEVRVPREEADAARRLIEEAKASGPQAAEEEELSTES